MVAKLAYLFKDGTIQSAQQATENSTPEKGSLVGSLFHGRKLKSASPEETYLSNVALIRAGDSVPRNQKHERTHGVTDGN